MSEELEVLRCCIIYFAGERTILKSPSAVIVSDVLIFQGSSSSCEFQSVQFHSNSFMLVLVVPIRLAIVLSFWSYHRVS